MSYTTIDNPHKFFNTVTYTGNASTQSITGVGFQPDWVWGKNRSSVTHHALQDAVRGNTKVIKSSSTNAESTVTNMVTSFDSDGFSLGSDSDMNGSSANQVAWNWKAGGSASSNSNGSITSSVSANTTSGFSIVSYTGTGSVATVGHGLGVAPKFIIVKTRSLSGEAWPVDIREQTGIVYLNETGAKGSYGDSSPFPSTAPTTTVFSIGTPNNTNGSGATYIAYCFAEVKGFSKFGSYTGNGNADGTFVYTGFRPAWVMTKRTDSTSGWIIRDNKRDTFNPSETSLYANATTADDTSGGASYYLDFLSNGFKFRGSGTAFNASSGSYIYMAFAEHPFVTAGTKAAGTAK